MYIKLPPKWTERLLALPESGMGYQIIDLTLEGGQQFRGVLVFNSEELYIPETQEFNVSEISRIQPHDPGR